MANRFFQIVGKNLAVQNTSTFTQWVLKLSFLIWKRKKSVNSINNWSKYKIFQFP